jgi:hypothetical protein
VISKKPLTPSVPAHSEPTREQVRAAVEMVCDYLNDAWSKKLMEQCGLTEVGALVAVSVCEGQSNPIQTGSGADAIL